MILIRQHHDEYLDRCKGALACYFKLSVCRFSTDCGEAVKQIILIKEIKDPETESQVHLSTYMSRESSITGQILICLVFIEIP